MKKLMLSLASLSLVVAPATSIVSCGLYGDESFRIKIAINKWGFISELVQRAITPMDYDRMLNEFSSDDKKELSKEFEKKYPKRVIEEPDPSQPGTVTAFNPDMNKRDGALLDEVNDIIQKYLVTMNNKYSPIHMKMRKEFDKTFKKLERDNFNKKGEDFATFDEDNIIRVRKVSGTTSETLYNYMAHYSNQESVISDNSLLDLISDYMADWTGFQTMIGEMLGMFRNLDQLISLFDFVQWSKLVNQFTRTNFLMAFQRMLISFGTASRILEFLNEHPKFRLHGSSKTKVVVDEYLQEQLAEFEGTEIGGAPLKQKNDTESNSKTKNILNSIMLAERKWNLYAESTSLNTQKLASQDGSGNVFLTKMDLANFGIKEILSTPKKGETKDQILKEAREKAEDQIFSIPGLSLYMQQAEPNDDGYHFKTFTDEEWQTDTSDFNPEGFRNFISNKDNIKSRVKRDLVGYIAFKAVDAKDTKKVWEQNGPNNKQAKEYGFDKFGVRIMPLTVRKPSGKGIPAQLGDDIFWDCDYTPKGTKYYGWYTKLDHVRLYDGYVVFAVTKLAK